MEASIKILLEIIIQRYLNESYCLTIISAGGGDYFTGNVQTVRLDKANMSIVTLATDIGCSDYVIEMDEPGQFVEIFERVHRLSNTRRDDRKLIFLPTNNTLSIESTLKLTPLKHIANILLIIPKFVNNCWAYDLVTHKFVGAKTSELSEPVVLDTWNECSKEFRVNANLFPHDISNLQGKRLKVACFTYEPFTMLDLDEHGRRDGLDMRLIEEFCSRVNCTIQLVIKDRDKWGTVYPNGSGIGVLGDVAMDRADFAISSLGQWHSIYQFSDLSSYLLRCSVACLVPAPSPISRWELPWLAFSPAAWASLFVILMYACLVLMLAQGRRGNAYMITIGISLAQPQNYDSRWRVRFVLLSLIMTSITINAAYSAGLSAIFTVPAYGDSIDTLQDLIDSGMEWAAPHEAWVYSMLPSTEPRIKKLLKKFRIATPEVLRARSFKRDLALAIEPLPEGYAIGSYVTPAAVVHYQLMLEEIYYEYNTVVARKSSAYIGKLNQLIGRLHETGVYHAWNTQIALQYLDYKVQLAVKYSRVKAPPENTAISLGHVVGVFMVHGIVSCIAFVVFLFEVISVRRKSNNNNNK